MDGEVSIRPSFFEVYASQHLNSALRPAFKFVLEILAVRNPRLIRLSNWSEEIFFSILLILESSHLRKESSLVAESFYSLRRSQQTSFHTKNVADVPLSTKQIITSLIFTIAVPYVKEKLDSWCSQATGGAAAPLFTNQFPGLSPSNEDDQVADTTSIQMLPPNFIDRIRRLIKIFCMFLKSQRFKLMVLKYYPKIRAVCEGINLIFNLLYLHGHSRFFSTSLALQGLILRRLQSSDLLQFTLQSNPDSAQTISSSHFFANIFRKLFALLKGGFFTAIFAFRFLQFYYRAEESTPRETGPVIPPPEPLHPSNRSTVHLTGPKHCPICQQVYVNPTACRTSGYVFCYTCILQHLQNDPTCPVTFAPTKIEDLVRVYDDAM